MHERPTNSAAASSAPVLLNFSEFLEILMGEVQSLSVPFMPGSDLRQEIRREFLESLEAWEDRFTYRISAVSKQPRLAIGEVEEYLRELAECAAHSKLFKQPSMQELLLKNLTITIVKPNMVVQNHGNGDLTFSGSFNLTCGEEECPSEYHFFMKGVPKAKDDESLLDRINRGYENRDLIKHPCFAQNMQFDLGSLPSLPFLSACVEEVKKHQIHQEKQKVSEVLEGLFPQEKKPTESLVYHVFNNCR